MGLSFMRLQLGVIGGEFVWSKMISPVQKKKKKKQQQLNPYMYM